MACGGPSKEFAVIKSQEAFDDVIRMMREKYQVSKPDIVLGIGIEKKWQDDWDEEEDALRQVLADMFWTSDAASF